ncbi:YeeE/YedE thiosulfate transporter family protein [Marinobacterium rhizophilum]|uniref:YeeE/YedE family protein n=1 Tax=Marinobacterium rhizophilum TaxID=420402 RepID=A0ABY5HHV5_9GAMM|nr:YeeE/YedE thiosulfate transporter family protein [Marinobacterium rhizophilum]UTW11875.1 YeeE/YedE family protein [Marinobacterium rhizophilum]
MLLLTGAVLLVVILGYMTQTTGLCMVRGVREWSQGRPEVMLSILCCGVLVWAVAVASRHLGTGIPFLVFEPGPWFAVGGLLFGLGTALNQGCSISTLSRLASGELQMLTTPLGWVAGWCSLAYWQPNLEVTMLPGPGPGVFALLAAITCALALWALLGNPLRRNLWLGMMGIGLLSGILYLYEPGWSPSGLLQDQVAALMDPDGRQTPRLARYALVLALLFGMSVAARRLNKLQLRPAGTGPLLLHFIAGTLMGIGAALAMGGNDSQLLLALPAFSPAGFLTVACILAGIRLGLFILARTQGRETA